jgi:hypothetical protein
MQETEVIQNHPNSHVLAIRQGGARHMKYKSLNLIRGQPYDLGVHKNSDITCCISLH